MNYEVLYRSINAIAVLSGNPQPNIHQIEWYSNDARLNQGDTNVRFSEDFLTLYRSAVSCSVYLLTGLIWSFYNVALVRLSWSCYLVVMELLLGCYEAVN